MTQDDIASEQEEIPVSYTAVGCTHKDLVLLKSVISLYGTQGNVAWDFQRSLEVDLVVIGTEMKPFEVISLLRSRTGGGGLILWISDSPYVSNTYQILHCKPPLHAFQLAEQLKQVEFLMRGKLATRPASPVSSAPPAVAHHDAFPENTRVELVRWPSPELLAENRNFWRMAAMLGARSMTLNELAERSEQPREICQRFFRNLNHAGYVSLLDSDDAQQTAASAHPLPEEAPARQNSGSGGGLRGLLRRIRIGLGFSSA
ncbi:MAG: hypothetical protein LBB76_05735 [Azoarcus sp.]|jgi:hypothetical protein|nr:hypothetical protein [Azoarcus sp.]